MTLGLLSSAGKKGYSKALTMPGGRSSAVHPIVITLTGNFANSSGTGGGGGGCQPQAANMVMPNSEAIHLRIPPIPFSALGT